MNYIICFWDKSKIKIPEDTALKLIDAIKQESIKSFSIESNLYMVGGVEKIINIHEAFAIFPDHNEILQRLEIKQPQFLTKLSENNNPKQLN